MKVLVRALRGYPSLLFACCLLFATVLPAFAVDAEIRTVSTDVLRDMVYERKNFMLIDARTHLEYQEAHIVGAVHMTEKDFPDAASRLPADKGALLVFYCNGVKCGKSKKTATKAKEAGYLNVMVYVEGFPVWEEKGYPIVTGPEYATKVEAKTLSARDLARALQEKRDEVVLVDVRDYYEFVEGHIEGAINIPAETFAVQSATLPKEKSIVVYCNTGSRSYTAYRKLMKLAYPNIFQSKLSDWRDSGFPVTQPEL